MAINNVIPPFGLKVQIKKYKNESSPHGRSNILFIAIYMYEYLEPADNFTLF